ncbi:DNA primase [Ectothiorhodospira lacustris]|uniref:DNA primase n=1 Tax=Ectothiorhodospira lacustris TaxID=2899127 RepID=UPI001EE7F9C2|nr:DNA primase [Ectothiorhodospira lacustris]MCG5509638.1 DNA primase [Ectothiorhodospira lacustris]MCG5521567.1 DNA primase [Ectothiorhodospira lacustris]
MSRIPQTFIDELLARTDIVELVGSRVTLKKQGREYTACCPFHAEKTPSFYVTPQKQFYHCFGCGAHGTAISFLMEYDNMEFVEAVEELARRAGMDVPRESGPGRRDSEDFQRLIAAQEAAAAHFTDNLRHHPEAVDYLKQRGLTGEIARDYRLGFAPNVRDDLLRTLSGEFEEQELLSAGLATRRDSGPPYDRFRGRIMFPIRDSRGRVVGFGGRLLGPGDPKYLNTPETPVFHKGQHLYGLYEARKASPRLEELLVVEGYMDVIALAQFGLRNAVATLGTATTRDHLERLFRVVPHLVFCFDGDRAGREAAWRALEQTLPVMRDGRQVRFLFLPEGEDPDTLVRREGPEGLQARMRQARPLSDVLIDGLRQRHDAGTREGRAALGAQAARLIRDMPEGLLRAQIINELAQLASVSTDQFERGLGPRAPDDTPAPSPPPRPSPATRRQRLEITPVRLALSVLLDQPTLAQDLGDMHWLEHLNTPGVKVLVQVLETLRQNPHLTTAGLLERWRDSETGRHLLKLAQWQPPPSQEEAVPKLLQDALGRLRQQYIQQRTEALLAKASRAALSDDEKAELKTLLIRKPQ